MTYRNDFTLPAELLEQVQAQGVAKLWVNEVFDMWLVVWKQLLVKLPTIESKHKQLQCILQRFQATRKTARFASQTSEIMT